MRFSHQFSRSLHSAILEASTGTLRAVVSPSRTLRYEEKETTDCLRSSLNAKLGMFTS